MLAEHSHMLRLGALGLALSSEPHHLCASTLCCGSMPAAVLHRVIAAVMLTAVQTLAMGCWM